MKQCNGCGREYDETVTCCEACGSEAFSSLCGRCGTAFAGKKCPVCGLRTGERERICPTCTTRTYEKICPQCGQTLRGWEYQKAIAVTRSAYGRMYAGRVGQPQRREAQGKNVLLILFTLAAASFGLMWLVAFRRGLRPVWKILTGIFVLLWGLGTIYLQIMPLNENSMMNIAAAVLLCVIPGIWGIVKGFCERGKA